MRRKIVWMVVSGWMVAALLLTSCASAVVEEEPEKVAPKQEVPKEKVALEAVVPEKEANMVKWTGTKRDGTVVEKMIEKPRYGGTLTLMSKSELPTGPAFDSVIRFGGNWHVRLASESLLQTDRLRWPAGTGECSGLYSIYPEPSLRAPALAEGIEFVASDTLVYHIRMGISWQA